MAKGPKKQTFINPLITSLKVLAQIDVTLDRQWEHHVVLKDGWAMMHNGIIAAGERITESFNICPHNDLLIQALSKCGQNVSFTELETQRLSVKSDKFRAIIPCLSLYDMMIPSPDPRCATVDDRLKDAIRAVSALADDDPTRLIKASILIDSGSAYATDGHVLIEAWHGIDLPPMLALPKAIIAPLVKNQKKLSGFGYSQSSCTFYYDDGSWIKSQFYADKWPDVAHAINQASQQTPLPDNFYDGLAAVEKFSDDGYVYFDNGVLRSHRTADEGASYEVLGLPQGPIMKISNLKMIKPYVKTVDFLARNGKMLMWYGENVRGAIMGRSDR
mgnify:CR=1 FL=1